MSKEDRYSHLGDEIDDEAPDEQADDEAPDEQADDEAPDEQADDEAPDERDADDASSEIHVTIDDGDEETVLTVDSDAVSADDLRDVIQTAPDDDASPSLPPGVRSVLSAQRTALNVGVVGSAAALNQALSALSREDSE